MKLIIRIRTCFYMLAISQMHWLYDYNFTNVLFEMFLSSLAVSKKNVTFVLLMICQHYVLCFSTIQTSLVHHSQRGQ